MGYLCFQIGCMFAEYDQFKPTISIRNCIYMNFPINLTEVLYQFLEKVTSVINLMGRDQGLKCLAFILYHLSFFLYSPF